MASELALHVNDDELSDRELDVLRRVAAGGCNKRVAADMGLSEVTIKSHIKNNMAKLGANDRTHAVTIAVQRGIIQL